VTRGPTARARATQYRSRRATYLRVCDAVDKRDGDTCRCCGVWVGYARHHHHIIYRSQRGTHSIDNLLVLCPRCHDAVHRHEVDVEGDAESAVFTWRRR
jgi:5-methylcytosine-specific restriction endonuclease McrA